MTEAVPAAPEVSGTPIEQVPQAPNPAEAGNPAKQEAPVERGQPPKGEERKSLDDIIKGAHEKATEKAGDKEKGKEQPKEPVKAKEDAPKVEKKADPKADAKPDEGKDPAKAQPEKGPDGRFVAKNQPQDGQQPQQQPPQTQQQPQQRAPHHEAPSRFDDAAKAEWEGVPESVKGAVHRSFKEMEGGIQKYKTDADAYGEVKEFDALAKQHGTTLKQAMTQYVNLDRSLKAQDPQQKMAALQHVFDYAGINPREWAARIMGQEPDQAVTQMEGSVRHLRTENTRLTNENQQMRQQLQQTQSDAMAQFVSSFAEQHPRFDELADEIAVEAKIIRQADQSLDHKKVLELAYKRVDRMNPTTQQEPLTPAQTPAQTRTPEPANPAGQKSISGAPASGSDPAIPAKRKGQGVSIDDALKRAQARLAS